MTDIPAPKPGSRSATPSGPSAADRREREPRIRMSPDQERAVAILARERMLSKTSRVYSHPDALRVMERVIYNLQAREIMGLDGGPQRRPQKLRGVADVSRILREKPELRKAVRRLVEEVQVLWPGTTMEAIIAFLDDLAETALELTHIDPEHLAKWLETVLMVGAAAVATPGSPVQPMRLPTREDFLAVSQMTDQNLAGLEGEFGKVGNAEAMMVSSVVVAQDQGILGDPIGIVAGTTHTFCTREALGLGRVAMRADLDDVAAGHAEEDDPIYHVVRSVAYFVVPTTRGGQRMIRALTLPLVAPGDLWTLKEGTALKRAATRKWLTGCGLMDLVDRNEVSCTAQQAHVARRLHDEYVARTGQTPPIVIPAIRIEHARSHRKFSSPIGPYTREMPGNTIKELRLMHQILGPKARIWLAEAGIEGASGDGALVKPNWKIRLPDNKFVPGMAAFVYPNLFRWPEIFASGDQLKLSELEYPVALGYRRAEDLVLLRAVGEFDPRSKSHPVMWLVASRALRSDPDLTNEVGELLLRLHGSRQDSGALREARNASFSTPAGVLGGRAKKPASWLTRELERELATFGGVLKDASVSDQT